MTKNFDQNESVEYILDVCKNNFAEGQRNTVNKNTVFCVRGRVVLFRRQGGIAFGKLTDSTGSIQFVLRRNNLGQEIFSDIVSKCSIGVIVELYGHTGVTSTGEHSFFVTQFKLLQKNSIPFPDKWHGIVDPETKLRKRGLDCILDENVRRTFKMRSQIISAIRQFMATEEFMEVETPVLSAAASGAQANPFITHHKALDADLYMRIAPETFLKRWVGAGFERVFEIGKNFRNEGIDPSHLQEFTAIEWYAAYFDYEDNLEMFKRLLVNIIRQVKEDLRLSDGRPDLRIYYQGETLHFDNIPVVTYEHVFRSYTGVDPFTLDPKEADELFKRKVRPNLVQPIFVKDYPARMMPMSQRKADNENIAECWQFIVNGWELVKCYSELVDPVLQRKLLEEQQLQKNGGDDEAMMVEPEFLEAMEYGIPPCSGLGIGIDRFVALLTNNVNLRDVVMFPTLLHR